MNEIFLTQLEIEGLPTMAFSDLTEGCSGLPTGLFYDSAGQVIGKKAGFVFNLQTQYFKTIEVTEDRGVEDEDLDEQQQTQTDRLLGLILDSPATLFHDSFGNAMIAVNGNGNKILKIHSKDFKTWLASLWWKKFKKGISGNIIDTATRTLEGQAIHDAEEIKLYTRTAELNGVWFYDLGNGQVIGITDVMWQLLSEPPILFYRYSHQRPQLEPQQGWGIKEIFNYLPYPDDEQEKLLLTLWLITSFMPDFYHPILLAHGEQGSRKTTLFKLLRSLIDPSVLETLPLRGDITEFIQQASHNYFLPFDNLSELKPEISDLLCRLVTGQGFSKRELFSDDSDIIYQFERVVGMNGINLAADKPDLLDRSVIIKLSPPEQYEDEKSLAERFDVAKPKLLGEIFDTLVKAKQELAKMPERIEGLANYRMAGFARHALAVGRVLGLSDEQIFSALQYNRQRQHSHVLDSSIFLQVLAKFMEDKPQWRGTPKELLDQLQAAVSENNIEIKHTTFPKNAGWVTRRIIEILPTLRTQGIEFNQERSEKRIITLTSKNVAAADDTVEKSFSFDEIAAGIPFNNPQTVDNVDNVGTQEALI